MIKIQSSNASKKYLIVSQRASTPARPSRTSSGTSSPPHDTQTPVVWKPLAFASLFLVLGGLLVFNVTREADFPTAEIEDLAVINSEDELEFFEELEFYIWIDEEQKV